MMKSLLFAIIWLFKICLWREEFFNLPGNGGLVKPYCLNTLSDSWHIDGVNTHCISTLHNLTRLQTISTTSLTNQLSSRLIRARVLYHVLEAGRAVCRTLLGWLLRSGSANKMTWPDGVVRCLHADWLIDVAWWSFGPNFPVRPFTRPGFPQRSRFPDFAARA